MRVIELSGRDRWTFNRFGEACTELGVSPQHVLHVGAHLGQEYPHYRLAGAKRITLMEPTPSSAEYLRVTYPDAMVIEAAAGTERRAATMSLCGGDGCWNTLRDPIRTGPGVHAVEGQITVEVVPISDVQGDADVLVVDTQGTEVFALIGACLEDPRLRLVVVETQNTGHPEAAHIDDVDTHMASRGWLPELVWLHETTGPYRGFADVFYLRKP